MSTPAIIFADGTQYWILNGEFHREDGPAVIYADGKQAWYLNDMLHRLDGPAVTYATGQQYWFLNGKHYADKKKFQEDANISDEDMTILLLKYNF